MSRFNEPMKLNETMFNKDLKAEDFRGREHLRCPNCGSFALYVDSIRGERVCDNCGLEHWAEKWVMGSLSRKVTA